MAAVALFFQFFTGGHDAGTKGGEMDRADQFQRTPLLLAENRLVAVLEEVAMPLMTTTIESGRVAAGQCRCSMAQKEPRLRDDLINLNNRLDVGEVANVSHDFLAICRECPL